MNLKELFGFKQRSFGFYVSLVFGVLLIVTGALYLENFKTDFIVLITDTEFRPVIGILPIVAGILVLGMSMFKVTSKYAPYVGGVFMLATFCLFILNIYMFVANCIIDIDFHPQDMNNKIFILPLVFMCITFVVAIVNCFLPQVKKTETEHCNCNEETKEGATDEK